VKAKIIVFAVLYSILAACTQEDGRSIDASPAEDAAASQTPSARPELTLEQEGTAPVYNPTWQQVESALLAIDPETRSFFVLVGENGYVQTAGAASRLTVEYRAVGPDSYSHYRLGREPLTENLVALSYSGGDIQVRASEILDIEDCLSIFRTYFEHGKVPDEYHLRQLDETYL